MKPLPVTRNAAERRQRNKAAKGSHECGRLWYAIRVLRKFPASELAAVAEVKSKPFVLAYLNKLRNAGYLKNRQQARNQEAIWTLVRDTGPRCPSILQGCTLVYDHNTCEVFLIEPQVAEIEEVVHAAH